jgi:hypothetical protein
MQVREGWRRARRLLSLINGVTGGGGGGGGVEEEQEQEQEEQEEDLIHYLDLAQR